MTISRVWLFRVLVLAVAGLMLLSWFWDWWHVNIYEIRDRAVVIHPWGLEKNVGAEYGTLIKDADMPPWFAPFMWSFLGVCMLALLIGMFVKDTPVRLGRLGAIVPRWLKRLPLPAWLIFGVGVAYIVCVIVAIVYAKIRTAQFWDLQLIGYSFIDLGYPYVSGADAGMQIGYWLACIVGPLFVILALYRHKILARKLSA